MTEADIKKTNELASGTIINGYRIERELGRGAMAIVYLATQLDLGRPVAFKVLSAELAADTDFVSRFFNEARAAAALSHPNIIQAIDAGETQNGLDYFCMEYVDGETLQDIIKREGRIPQAKALLWFSQIADALNYGWNLHKFTHGDIKPENIMINRQGQAKLADFGLARVDGHDYSGKVVMLTPLYAPPELIRGEQISEDCRPDIYAFGASLYHALAGTPPFPGTDAQVVIQRHLTEELEPLSHRNMLIPKELSDFVSSMLVKDINGRLDSWLLILERLKHLSTIVSAGKRPLSLSKKETTPDQSAKKGASGAKPRAVPQASGKKNAKGATVFLVVLFFLLIVLGAMIALVVSKQRSESASGQLNYELESGQKLNGSEAKPENTSPPTGNVSEPETRLPSRAETVGGDSTIADGRTTTIANSSGGKASVELQPVVEASAAAVVTTEQSTTDVKTDSEDSQETTGEETDGQAKTEAADSQEEADDTTLQAKNDGEENTATAKEAIRADHLLSYDLNNSQIEFMANLQLALLWLERSAPTIRLQNLHAFEEALKAYREQEDCPESQKASAKFVEEELLTGYRRLPTVLKERMQEIRQMSFTVDRETWNVQEFGDMDAKMSMVKVSKPGGSNHLPKDWATLQKRGIIAGICRQLIESGKHQLSEDTSLLASLALTGQIREYARLLKTYQLGEDDSFWILPVEWERFRENQKAERNALGLLQQIIVYADNDSIEGVYVKAGELTDKYSSTQLYAILSPMVQPLFENCKGICSAEKSKQLLKDSQNSLLENEISSPSEVYSPLMFWIARYGNPAQGSKIENKNERLLDNAIKRLAEDENYAPTSIDFVRAVPFLLTDTQERRADLSPTMAQKYLSENKEDAKKDKVFKRLDSQMSILARLEIGDWNYARKNNRQLQWKELDGMSVQELPDDGLPLSIASLYGRALLMARFEGDMDRADKSMAPLLKVNKSSRVAVAAYSAVLEYWLLTRRGQFSASDLPIPFAARSVLRNAMQAERQWQYDSKRKFAYLYLAALFESGLDSEALNLLKSIDKDKDDIVEKLDIKEHYQPYFTELIEIHEAATNDEDAEGNISQLEKKVAAFHDVKYTMEYFKAKFSACGERPLTGKRDRQFKDLFSKYLPFSRLIGGDVCWDWTLRRIAWELAEDNMENAMEVAEWVLEQQYASLIPYYGRLLALRAGLRLLQGRHDALLDATFLAEKATVLSDGEQKFFKSFASYPRIGDYKFKGTSRHQEYFWYQWLMACEQFGEKGKESSEFNALQGRREENALSERVLLTGLEKFIQKR